MTSYRRSRIRQAAVVALALVWPAGPGRADVDRGVIRIAPSTEAIADSPTTDDVSLPEQLTGPRRGFDYDAFDARLEGLWFQRKALLADGRHGDAARHAEMIRSFVAEEGVRRLEAPAGALLVEADRLAAEGSYDRALSSLALAEQLDPGRPQIRFARADVLRRSGAGTLAAAAEGLAGLRRILDEPFHDPTTLHPAGLLLVVAMTGLVALFALLMVVRHHVSIRHEIEEWLSHRGHERWASMGGWAFLFMPALTWVGASWIVFYWILIAFRFMRRSEKLAAATLLAIATLIAPAFRFAIGLYALAADPMVRTTLAAANGVYDPDRIVRLRELVASHPDSPAYRFLLAGLYKNGRYFEEAYEQYRKVLDLAPSTYQARINIGNIFFVMGQYGESIAQYRKAIDVKSDSALAHYNLYLAQNNAFRLNESKATLDRARALDPELVDGLLSSGRGDGERPLVVDATVDFATTLRAALDGDRLGRWLDADPGGRGWRSLAGTLVNPLTSVSLLTLVAVATITVAAWGRPRARSCVRCGRPFCAYCKTGRDHPEYCSQCVHLFVLGDGLAPETKSRKLYEVERHQRVGRRARRLASLVLPGSGSVLRGRAWAGLALIASWTLAILAWEPGLLTPVTSWLGLPLRLDRLGSVVLPPTHAVDPVTLLAASVAIAVWLVANVPPFRSREA